MAARRQKSQTKLENLQRHARERHRPPKRKSLWVELHGETMKNQRRKREIGHNRRNSGERFKGDNAPVKQPKTGESDDENLGSRSKSRHESAPGTRIERENGHENRSLGTEFED